MPHVGTCVHNNMIFYKALDITIKCDNANWFVVRVALC